MTAHGIVSRTSPIIVDDDDDDLISPSRASTSTSPPKTPQEPIDVDSIEVRNTTHSKSKQGPSGQLKNGIGYSILVRMGYKPGHGLGVNLEGIRPLQPLIWVVDLASRCDQPRQSPYAASKIPRWPRFTQYYLFFECALQRCPEWRPRNKQQSLQACDI
jgi:hypothetical protein